MEKSYNPALFEDKWLSFWLKEGFFHADESKVLSGKKKPFSVVLPPPNVTGVLHIGHALNATLQDIICRWKRMKGYEVCWVPGTDHAGIATQWVVERELAKEGLTRHDVGRQELLRRIWDWKEKFGSRIINQLKKLGASCDWQRERFTMDEGFSRAVRRAFVELYKEGLIYRGKRLINWCPRCKTALSDLEVEHEQEKGFLWYIKYPLSEGNGFITVATTRPETMLGDTAVAVNPQDERYKDLVGKEVILPIVNRKIPIIADQAVDPEFGTGAVKITPAHDFNDFEVAQRHNLPMIKIMDEDARITVEPFKGLDRFEAREAIVEMLKEDNLLEKVEPIEHAVGHCYRCKTVIEPMLSNQWFVKTKPLAERAAEAVKNAEMQFIPKQWENTFFAWMSNIKDWCISRQIWWGHRIPAWYCSECGHVTVSEESPSVCEACGSRQIKQDEDVLDTWFSSALWPFGVFGWPEKTPDLEAFYPTDMLVTGFDIIFFWVSRMMMMGLHFTGQKPFSDIYVHALVRDEHGQKMSKTKGNVIDPLEVIKKFGADTLRFTLASLAAQGRDIRLSWKVIEGYKHFANKIWNIARFILTTTYPQESFFDENKLKIEDRWILGELSKTAKQVEKALSNYRFNEAAKSVYSFVWEKFADWYIEFTKPRIYRGSDEDKATASGVLRFVLRETLKLLHPFMPFITEEIYQRLEPFEKDAKSITVAPWPQVLPYESVSSVDAVRKMITEIRALKAELSIPSSSVQISVKTNDRDFKEALKHMFEAIRHTAKVESIDFTDEKPKDSVSLVMPEGEVFVKVAGIIDVRGQIERLNRKLTKIEKELSKLEKKLSNENFLKKAPKEVVSKAKLEMKELKELSQKLKETISQLEEI